MVSSTTLEATASISTRKNVILEKVLIIPKKAVIMAGTILQSIQMNMLVEWGVKIMPTLNKNNPAVQQFFMGKEGVIHHWLSKGADGFRLDVADELGDLFLDGIHARVKAENPSKLVLGEVWENASNKISYSVQRRYLQGKQLDSVMNYPFKDAILNFFQDHDGEEFCERILTIVENYPTPVLNLVMNSISTHDTLRAITALAGPPRNSLSKDLQATYQMDWGTYQHGKYLLKMAAALQFTLPGIPCIYYGDEAGMQGYGDPFNHGAAIPGERR